MRFVEYHFKTLPSVYQILILLQERTCFRYQILIRNRCEINGFEHYLHIGFHNITPIFQQIYEYYGMKTGQTWRVVLDPDKQTIGLGSTKSYEIQVFRKIMLDLGSTGEMEEDHNPYTDEFIYTDMFIKDPIPHYAMLPWYHKDIPISSLSLLRENIGWNPENRPPFVSKEFIEQIERGMPISKPRRKK